MKELWDAYNAECERLDNVTLVRGEAIPEGLYHLSCEVTVRHTDGTILLTKRDLSKKYGGLWESTAGGCAQRSESSLDCVLRELLEETGIKAKADEIYEVKKAVMPDKHEILVYYICNTDCEKDSITLQEGETIDYMWATKEEILAMDDTVLVHFGARSIIEALD